MSREIADAIKIIGPQSQPDFAAVFYRNPAKKFQHLAFHGVKLLKPMENRTLALAPAKLS